MKSNKPPDALKQTKLPDADPSSLSPSDTSCAPTN